MNDLDGLLTFVSIQEKDNGLPVGVFVSSCWALVRLETDLVHEDKMFPTWTDFVAWARANGISPPQGLVTETTKGE